MPLPESPQAVQLQIGLGETKLISVRLVERSIPWVRGQSNFKIALEELVILRSKETWCGGNRFQWTFAQLRQEEGPGPML